MTPLRQPRTDTTLTKLVSSRELKHTAFPEIIGRLWITQEETQAHINDLFLNTDEFGLVGLHLAPKLKESLLRLNSPQFTGLDWLEGIWAHKKQQELKLKSTERSVNPYTGKYSYDLPFTHFSIHYPTGEFVCDAHQVGTSQVDQIIEWGTHPHQQYLQCAYTQKTLLTRPYCSSMDMIHYDHQKDKAVHLWVLARLYENQLPLATLFTLSTNKECFQQQGLRE